MANTLKETRRDRYKLLFLSVSWSKQCVSTKEGDTDSTSDSLKSSYIH